MSEPSSPAPGGVEWKVLALQLFVLPMAIVAACVGIFLLFGLMADDKKDARTLVAEIRRHDSGSSLMVWDRNARWQAAKELPERIEKEKAALAKDPAFCRSLVEIFEDTRYPDPDIRAWMAMSMGQLGDSQAVPVLVHGLSDASEESRPARYACAWALGALKAPEAVPALAPLLEDAPPPLRKIAAYALGAIGDPPALQALGRALRDGSAPVRWTAATWLAKRGDAAAVPVLAVFLDRKTVEGMTEFQPEERDTILAGAAKASGALKSSELKAALEALAKDPSQPVSLAAQEALIAYQRPSTAPASAR